MGTRYSVIPWKWRWSLAYLTTKKVKLRVYPTWVSQASFVNCVCTLFFKSCMPSVHIAFKLEHGTAKYFHKVLEETINTRTTKKLSCVSVPLLVLSEYWSFPLELCGNIWLYHAQVWKLCKHLACMTWRTVRTQLTKDAWETQVGYTCSLIFLVVRYGRLHLHFHGLMSI